MAAATTRQKPRRGISAPAGAETDQISALGYTRVSTAEQGDSGAGLAAQRKAIRSACEDRGFSLVDTFEDVASAKDLRRPKLTECLTLLDQKGADVLVVSKLDRLSRSILDFATLMARARSKGWALVCLDIGVDTTEPAGALVANVMASFAEFERERIRERTRDALAARRAEGVQLGRRRQVPDEVIDRIVALRAAGASLPKIADALNSDGVRTAQGGAQWYPSTVRGVLRLREFGASR